MFPLSKSEILYGVRGEGCYHQIESVPKLFPQVNTVPGLCLPKWNRQLNFKEEMEIKACLESRRWKIPEPTHVSLITVDDLRSTIPLTFQSSCFLGITYASEVCEAA